MSKIGKIYLSIFPYFDKISKKQKYKSRPIIIIAEPIGLDTEYTVLPVSTVSNQSFYNPIYDTELLPNEFPKLMINQKSYIRSHKQTTVYRSSIDFNKCIGDLRTEYSDTFYEVIKKLEEFNGSILENC